MIMAPFYVPINPALNQRREGSWHRNLISFLLSFFPLFWEVGIHWVCRMSGGPHVQSSASAIQTPLCVCVHRHSTQMTARQSREVLVEKLVCQITDRLHNSYMALSLVRGCFVVTSKRQATVRTCLQQLWLHIQPAGLSACHLLPL